MKKEENPRIFFLKRAKGLDEGEHAAAAKRKAWYSTLYRASMVDKRSAIHWITLQTLDVPDQAVAQESVLETWVSIYIFCLEICTAIMKHR